MIIIINQYSYHALSLAYHIIVIYIYVTISENIVKKKPLSLKSIISRKSYPNLNLCDDFTY